MEPNSRRLPSYQAGFTLVEIMVGLTIGMLATLVIVQVMSVFEAQKSTTTGTADAQTNGGIALYTLGRELQMAGYALLPVTNSPLECTTLTVDGTATNINRLSPVTIIDGVAVAGVSSASDTITLHYGNSLMGGVPTQTTGLPIASALSPAPAQDVAVASNLGCKANDIILITSGTACTMSNVVAVPGTTTVTFANPAAPPLTATQTTAATVAAAAPAGVNLACLGTWTEVTYAVNNGNLQRAGVDSVAGIVNIQVQYGVSAAANSNQITRWINADNIADWDGDDGAATGDDWGASLTVANRNRIKAVRIAVVARNAKMEPAAVTTACSSLTAAAPTGLCAWAGSAASPAPRIDLSPGNPNWARYRYRVFETIIPLRTVIWSKDTL